MLYYCAVLLNTVLLNAVLCCLTELCVLYCHAVLQNTVCCSAVLLNTVCCIAVLSYRTLCVVLSCCLTEHCVVMSCCLTEHCVLYCHAVLHLQNTVLYCAVLQNTVCCIVVLSY